MTDRPPLRAGLAVIGVLVVCCAAPLLIGAIGGAGISALVAWGSRAILPIIGLLVVVAALILLLRTRRKHLAATRGDDPARPTSRSL
jgi:Na+/melibiose symporter-like transporter